jgi:hypothetical protein
MFIPTKPLMGIVECYVNACTFLLMGSPLQGLVLRYTIISPCHWPLLLYCWRSRQYHCYQQARLVVTVL